MPHSIGTFWKANWKMDNETIKAIEAIIKRGNDVEIRRKGDGYIVLEVKKTIKYSTSAQ